MSAEESITISKGLGPIQAIDSDLTLKIAPLTILIGPQGSGKSLISQFLYFMRNAEYLLSRQSIQDRNENELVRTTLEKIRSGDLPDRSLAAFLTTDTAQFTYKKDIDSNTVVERKFGLYRNNRLIKPLSPFQNETRDWLTKWREDVPSLGEITSNALFVPAERTFFSRFVNNPAPLFDNALPTTMREFAAFLLSSSTNLHKAWQSGTMERPPEVTQINEIIGDALGGRAIYTTRGPKSQSWQWRPSDTAQSHDIEMASSGQMGTWPLVSVAQALFGLKQRKRPLYFHVEEPETHLHPLAQVAIAKMLAFLVNQGIKVIITTHSLTMLYALNNLMLAHAKLNGSDPKNMPSSSVRLDSHNVAAYLIADGTAQSVVDDTGQIDEARLGSVLGDLEVQFNQLMTYKILWE